MIYFWFVFGAALGSFLNVCIYRLPRGESIVFPPSHCPQCGNRLFAMDLIPLLSYFLLKGKCRYCQAQISPRYPLVELLAGSSFSLTWLFTQGDIFGFVFYVLFVLMSIVIFFIDLEHQVIPDPLLIIGGVAGIIFNLFRGNLFSALIGMVLGYGLLWGVGKVGKWWFKKDAMGEGDFFLAAVLGAYLGWEGMLLALFIAYVAAAVVAIAFLFSGKVKFGQYIPFGPALVFGGITTLYFGAALIDWYLSLFL